MYAKKPRYRLRIGIICILLLCAVAGSTVAKYVTARELTGTVTFSAKLAKEMTLLESLAIRQTDGSYILGTAKTDKNEYVLLPGLDVPKDPTITITDKTPIEAYLFVEVVDELQSGTSYVTYSVNEYHDTDNPAGVWTNLGITGKNVYVYSENGVAKRITTDVSVSILKDNKIYVSQNLNHAAKDLKLNFVASMGEVASGATPLEVYNSIG